MKKITLFVALIGICSISSAQAPAKDGWNPNPKIASAASVGKLDKKESTQCYGTVIDHQTKEPRRCKIKGQASKDGKYYCRFHVDQK